MYTQRTKYIVYGIQYKHKFIGSESHPSKVNIRTITVPLKQCRISLSGMEIWCRTTIHWCSNSKWDFPTKMQCFSCMGLKVFFFSHRMTYISIVDNRERVWHWDTYTVLVRQIKVWPTVSFIVVFFYTIRNLSFSK